MVAFHFPPMSGTSGVQRTLRFVRELPEHGWQPVVLTAQPRAYEMVSDDLLGDVPAATVVERAFALDTARHLALFGRYPGHLARPDRWMSWRLRAVPAGMRLIERWQPAALWSTYPIATAHDIGADLARRSSLPWVAEFRDPMAHEGYPADPRTWQSFLEVERRTFPAAAATVFASEGAARLYRHRYPDVAARMHVIENGYDEESFVAAQSRAGARTPLDAGAFTLLHSGVVYPEWRHPGTLFRALRQLRERDDAATASLRIRFRASGNDDVIRALAREHGVLDRVDLLPVLPYQEALEEMLRADALLVLQSDGCNDQVPAKLYEYFRAGRPVLALTDPAGDTAAAMGRFGAGGVVPLDAVDDIAEALPRFVAAVTAGAAAIADPVRVAQASRRAKAAELAALLDAVADEPRATRH